MHSTVELYIQKCLGTVKPCFYMEMIFQISATVMSMLDCSSSLCWDLQANHVCWAEDVQMLQ